MNDIFPRSFPEFKNTIFLSFFFLKGMFQLKLKFNIKTTSSIPNPDEDPVLSWPIDQCNVSLLMEERVGQGCLGSFHKKRILLSISVTDIVSSLCHIPVWP